MNMNVSFEEQSEIIHTDFKEEQNEIIRTKFKEACVVKITEDITVLVTQTDEGALIEVIDSDGTTQAIIHNGKDGYTPKKGVDYFDGKDGQDGYTPIKGVDYFDGKDGKDGLNGKDGEAGPQGPEGPQGPRGETGEQGPKGETGATGPQGNPGAEGPKGEQGPAGADGYTPQKGKDYFTAADKAEIVNDLANSAPVQSVNGKTGTVSLTAQDVSARPSTWMPTYSDVGAEKSGTANSVVSGHNTNTEAHNDIRLSIATLISRLDALANSDDDTLDQMAEVVAYIKDNRNLIEQITTGKVSVTDIVNNLTTNVSNKPLSAAQGVALKALIDAISVPTKVSQLTNDKGYITGYTETDPTVPAWAKASNKPSYTATEITVDTDSWRSDEPSTGDWEYGNITLDELLQVIAADLDDNNTSLSDALSSLNRLCKATINKKFIINSPTLTAEDVGALSTDTLPTAINTALAQAKDSGEFAGSDGNYIYLTIGNPKYGPEGDNLDTIHNIMFEFNSINVTVPEGRELQIGDLILQEIDGNLFEIVDMSPAGSGTFDLSLRGLITLKGTAGANGTSVTISNITESDADGGSNVVRFSNGSTMTIKNGKAGSVGKDGKTPVKGTDYFTAADKAEMVNAVIQALPVYSGEVV